MQASEFNVPLYKGLKLLQTPRLHCDKPNGLQDTPFTPETHARSQTDGKLSRSDPRHSH